MSYPENRNSTVGAHTAMCSNVVPGQAEAVPGQVEAVPGQAGAVPGQAGAVPGQAGILEDSIEKTSNVENIIIMNSYMNSRMSETTDGDRRRDMDMGQGSAHSCFSNVMFEAYHIFVHNMQLDDSSDELEVRSSSVHGQGVFSKKSISADEFVTLYDVTAIGYVDQKEGKLYAMGDEAAIAANVSYSFIGNFKSKPYLLMASPLFRDICRAAHMINDLSVKVVPGDKDDQRWDVTDVSFKNTFRAIDFIISYRDNSNVKLENIQYPNGNVLCVAVTSRKIVPGEELSVFYGLHYWMIGRHDFNSKLITLLDNKYPVVEHKFHPFYRALLARANAFITTRTQKEKIMQAENRINSYYMSLKMKQCSIQ